MHLCFIRDQPDKTAVTLSQCACTRSQSSFWIQPLSHWPQESNPALQTDASAVTWTWQWHFKVDCQTVTGGWLLCTFLVFWNSTSLYSSEFPDFLSMMTSYPIWKIQKTRMANAAKMVVLMMAETINSAIYHNMNSLCSSSSGGYCKELISFMEHNRSAKSDKYQSQFFVMLCEHCKHCLKYFNLNFSLIPCFASHSIKQVLCIESVGYLKFLWIIVALYDTVIYTKSVRSLSFPFLSYWLQSRICGYQHWHWFGFRLQGLGHLIEAWQAAPRTR